MKKLLLALGIIVGITTYAADVKISNLPLGTGPGINTNDSFPYVNASAGSTMRLKISALPETPAMQIALDTKQSTGTAVLPYAGTTDLAVMNWRGTSGLLANNSSVLIKNADSIVIPGYASVGTTLTAGTSVTSASFIGPLTGAVTGNVTGNLTGNVTGNLTGTVTGHSTLDLPLTGGTMTGALIFTDNTYDIGASGATRPRTGYFGTSLVAPSFVGALTGSASGNLSATANQYGVLLSGAANVASVLAPDASTAKVLVSGGASANPAWSLLTNTNLSGSAAISNANLATVSTATFKGRTTAGTGAPEDLTATQATALLNNLVGDSGSGGTKGLAPAPSAGDAAALKFLKADGTWSVPAGAGDVTGQASSVDSEISLFSGTGGKTIKRATGTGIAHVTSGVYSASTIVNADVSSSAAIVASKIAFTVPTIQRFTTGSGTYTTPAGVTHLIVEVVGGGGGGGAGGTSSPGAGGGGAVTQFGATLSAGAGQGGTPAGGGGCGANTSISTVMVNVLGGSGSGAGQQANYAYTGKGGDSVFGGGGGGGEAGAAGYAAAANTGSGGGGGSSGTGSGANAGGGGGAGGYMKILISSPAATYAYAVGTGGAGGVAVAQGQNGGAGAAGIIIVTEYYN